MLLQIYSLPEVTTLQKMQEGLSNAETVATLIWQVPLQLPRVPIISALLNLVPFCVNVVVAYSNLTNTDI